MEKIRKIHMTGICGVAMGTLACMLKEKGYHVTGSDENVYPPMSITLEKLGIDIQKGYRESNLDGPDLAVIGNAISRGNPEAEYILNKNIPYVSMARAIYDFFLKDKEVISVSGTHGKSTTTALLGHILESAGLSPSFLVGGVLRNYDSNYKLGSGRFFVIEGDEYDSAFFEKIPKFVLYRPRHAILTSLEFDHADIFRDLDEIITWFKRLVRMIPSEGNILYSSQYPVLENVMTQSFSRNFSFGSDAGDIKIKFLGYNGDFSQLSLTSGIHGELSLKTGLMGSYNYANIAGAASMALTLGVPAGDIEKAVETFHGVKRRQELIYSGNALKIYEDFAHHPTSIEFVLSELRMRYPDACLWAIYEPRSATSRRNVFQEKLPQAFSSADRVYIKSPFRLDVIPEDERIDIHRVMDKIKKAGIEAELLPAVDDIVESIFSSVTLKRKNIIVVMSNGGFDGIYAKLIKRAGEAEGINI